MCLKRLSVFIIIALSGRALAEGPVLDLPGFPDYLIVGVGAGPEYIGADEGIWAVVPAALKGFGERYVSLEANYLSVNMLTDPNWRAGPAGILRFGRSDVSDDRVARLPEVDMSIDLGAFAASAQHLQ
jgi:outer membrane protein